MKKQMLKSALIALAGVGLLSGSALALTIDIDINASNDTYDAHGLFSDSVISGVANGTLSSGIVPNYFYVNVGAQSIDNSSLLTFNTLDVNTYDNQGVITVTVSEDYTGGTDYSSFISSVNKTNLTGFNTKTLTITITDSYNIDATYTFAGFDEITNIDTTSLNFDNGFSITALLSLTGAGNLNFDSTTAAAVPEPATMLLFGTGIAGLAGIARRRK